MAEKKLYLIVQSVLCVLLVILLAVSAVSIYREGTARKAEDPMASVYTREIAAETDKGTTFHDFEKPGYEGQTIDYVFVRGDVPVSRFAVVRDRVDGDLPSDHYAVYADLAL